MWVKWRRIEFYERVVVVENETVKSKESKEKKSKFQMKIQHVRSKHIKKTKKSTFLCRWSLSLTLSRLGSRKRGRKNAKNRDKNAILLDNQTALKCIDNSIKKKNLQHPRENPRKMRFFFHYLLPVLSKVICF